MQPSEFWGSDTWTVMDAYDGYLMSKGVNVGGTRLTREEIRELKEFLGDSD